MRRASCAPTGPFARCRRPAGALAPVELESLAPAKAQRHIGSTGGHRAGFALPVPDEIGDPAVATVVALIADLLEQLESRPTLAARSMGIGFQGLRKPVGHAINISSTRLALVAHIAADRLSQPSLHRVSRQARPLRNLADRQEVAFWLLALANTGQICTSTAPKKQRPKIKGPALPCGSLYLLLLLLAGRLGLEPR